MSFERLKSYTVEADEKKVSFKLAPKTFGQKVYIRCSLVLKRIEIAYVIAVVVKNTSTVIIWQNKSSHSLVNRNY